MSDLMLEALEESRSDQILAGDEAAAVMLADIIEGYRGGWVSERNARIALFASERRLGNVSSADEKRDTLLKLANAMGED